MNIYVETNFILELTFEQEQSASCEQILQFCEAEQTKLFIPAYSLAEPHEKLSRQKLKISGSITGLRGILSKSSAKT